MTIQTTDSKAKRKRLIEEWEGIVNHLDLDLNKEDIYYVKANQIKEITRTSTYGKNGYTESVPPILRNSDRFLLSVSRNEYAIPKGKG